MITEERLAALEAQMAALVEPPTEYYTSRYSGEEIDKGIDGALQLGGASTPQGAIAALGAGVRPKLNDNPFFLINQRGQNSYTGARYGPDRWRVTGSHRLDMLDGGGVKLTVVSSSNSDQMIQQYLEPEIFERLNGKQVTLAVIVTENSMSRPSYFRVGATEYGNIPAGQIGLFFATLTLNYYSSANNYFGFQCSDRENQNGESISLKAFTFEAGENQTLGYVDDSGTVQLLEQPDPLELLKCQRYFYYAHNILCPGQIKNSNIYLAMYLPTKMRVIPSMTVKSYGTIINNGVSNVPTTFGSLVLSGNILHFRTNAPANTANYTPCVLTDLNVEISAEL